MSRRTAIVAILALCAAVAACKNEPSAGPVDFERQVAEVLSRRCVSCHNADDPKSGLDLSSSEGLRKGGLGGPVVVPKKPDASPLMKRVTAGTMPPKKAGPPLTEEEVAGLRNWVLAGAPWTEGRVLKSPETREGSSFRREP